jgi:hypothetical protein
MSGKVAAAEEAQAPDDILCSSVVRAVMGSKHYNRRNMRSNIRLRSIDIGRGRKGGRRQ